MEIINEKVSAGNRYGLTPALRAFFCETFQVTLSMELGVVCVSPFVAPRLRRKAEVKWVLDPLTGIEEPQLVLGEMEQREEQEAVFLMPLTRYDYKSGSGLRNVRISLAQLAECRRQEIAKDDLTVIYSEEVLKRAGVKVSRKAQVKSEEKAGDKLLTELGLLD